MDQFNNREIALAIWLLILIAIAWVMTIHSVPSVSKSLYEILKMFTKKLILIPLCLMATYVSLLVWGLYEIGVWDHSQLKNTIIWGVSVAAVSLFRVNEIEGDRHYFKKTVMNNLKLLVVLEFIINFYTFSLWVELIIVLIIALAGVMLAVSHTNKKYETETHLLNYFLALVGGGLFVYAVYNLVTDFGSFATRQTLVDFSLPLLLTFLYIPFLYIMALYVDYESAFLRLYFSIKDLSLRSYAKRRAILAFHFRTWLLKRWVRNLMTSPTENEQDIENSIREVFALWARERNPVEVSYDRGWSPYVAKGFLKSEGLVTDDYYRVRGGSNELFAFSPYLKIGDGVLANNVAYYVEGDEATATTLKLILNVNVPAESLNAREKFLDIAKLLCEKALHSEMPGEIVDCIVSETEITTQLNGKEVTVSKEFWPGDRFGGYGVKFVIQHINEQGRT